MLSNLALPIFINICISIIIIYGIHISWNYLKNTYSKKKTKDLVNTQIQKYKNMVDEIQQSKPIIDIKPPIITDLDKQTMDIELTAFMQTI